VQKVSHSAAAFHRDGARSLLLALAALSVGGCQGRDVVGPYRLGEVDIPEDTSLCYRLPSGDCVERIKETAFAAGYDETYVVAARHPHRFEDASLDRSRTEYYYIVRALDGPLKDPAAAVRGPFDEAAFGREKRLLGLPDFSIEIASLK
jgi:hypothetical protein